MRQRVGITIDVNMMTMMMHDYWLHVAELIIKFQLILLKKLVLFLNELRQTVDNKWLQNFIMSTNAVAFASDNKPQYM